MPCAANGTAPGAVLQLVFGVQWARVQQAPSAEASGGGVPGGIGDGAHGPVPAVNVSVPCGGGWAAQRYHLRSAEAVPRANWLRCTMASPGTVWIDDLTLAKAE